MQSNKKLQVGVIMGGRSGEHEVSLMSARSVLSALDVSRYDIVEIGITHEGVWYTGKNVVAALTENQLDRLTPVIVMPDPTHHNLYVLQISPGGADRLQKVCELEVVLPVLHGTFGEDGAIQGLLELMDIAYVGAGVLGSAAGMDKSIFKDIMRANGLPVVESIIVLRSQIERDMEAVIAQAEKLADYPLFVKPANLGSSVGITRCRTRADLMEGLLEAARFDRRVLIERGVHAREIEVSVLGNDDPQASIPGEVIPSREYYSYEAKYLDGTSELIIPAPLSERLASRLQNLAVRTFKAIDCSGLARVDFLLDMDHADEFADPMIYVSEINTLPGFTKISMYPKLWAASGLPYNLLLDRLIELALERKADRDRTERRYSRES